MMKKVYEADPPLCGRCSRPLKIVSLIDAPSIIVKIRRHRKLWDRSERHPPPARERSLHLDILTQHLRSN